MADMWEYKFLDGTDMLSKLNALGAQGWEAVGIIPIEVTATNMQQTSGLGVFFSNKWHGSSYSILLKRRKA